MMSAFAISLKVSTSSQFDGSPRHCGPTTSRFIAAVNKVTPIHLTLRQKDHHLWGLSLMEDVRKDLRAPVPARNPRKLKIAA